MQRRVLQRKDKGNIPAVDCPTKKDKSVLTSIV
jgi:hypothetical protein